MAKQMVDLGSGNVRKLLFSLSLPTITSQLVNMLYNLVDRIFIGHIQPAETVGTLALTGVGVCLPIGIVLMAFASLVSAGGAPRASIQEGRGNIREAERIMGNSFSLLLIIALLLTLLIQLFAEPLLMTFGASENTIGYALDYLRIYSLGTVFVQITLGMNAYITAQGFTSVSMKTVLLGAILNTILDPIFIFLLGWGVQGAAVATVLSQAASAIWVLRFLTGRQTKWHLAKEHLRPVPSVFLPCLALGLSPFIMQSTESLISICFNSSLLKYGSDLAVATMTILTSIMQFTMMPLLGLSQGAQPLLSYNFGARNLQRVKEAFRCLFIASLTCSMVCWVPIQLFPEIFVRIFNNNPELVAYASRSLRVYMGVSGIFGIQIACQQTFIALGNAKTSLFLAVLRKILLLIPLIYLLPCFFEDKAFAVFLAEPAADLLAVAATAFLFFRQFKQSLSAANPSGT